MTTTQEKATRRARQVFSAREKAQAVLSVWSGRRKPSAVCRSMGIAWGLLNSWEKSGLHGILKALGQEQVVPELGGLALGTRLEKLLTVPGTEVATAKGE